MRFSVFQGVFIGVFALAALIGLFVFATYTNKGGPGAVGTVTIWGTLPQDDVTNGLLESVKSDNTLKGVTYVQKDESTLPSDLAAAIATGNPPDLVLASQEDLLSLQAFIAPIPLANVSASSFTNTFADEGSLFAVPSNGGYYGLPLLIDPLVLFYNNAILTSQGISLPPSTWEALTGLVPNVAAYTATRQITRSLIALGTYSNVHDARAILSALFLQVGVPLTVRSGTTGQLSTDLGLNSPASGGEDPGSAVVRFYTQFADPSKVSYTWNSSLPDSEQAFGTGDLALYLGFASEARFLKDANPNLAFEVAPLPQPATASTKATYGLVYALMIPHGAKNAAGAFKAETVLLGAPEQAALASATGLAPATRAALGAANSADPIAAEAARSALYARGWLSPAPASVDQVFTGMINDVVSGKSLIPSALSTADRSLEALLGH